MKVLIAYATKYGTAEKCAKILAEKLNSEVDVIDLKSENIELAEYEAVIIGSSVYMGRVRKEARKFCEKRKNELQDKKLAFFLNCMGEGEKAREQIKDNLPEDLIEQAEVTGIFGGEFDFEKMNFFERIIVKKVGGIKESKSNILEDNIDNFAREINRLEK